MPYYKLNRGSIFWDPSQKTNQKLLNNQTLELEETPTVVIAVQNGHLVEVPSPETEKAEAKTAKTKEAKADEATK